MYTQAQTHTHTVPLFFLHLFTFLFLLLSFYIIYTHFFYTIMDFTLFLQKHLLLDKKLKVILLNIRELHFPLGVASSLFRLTNFKHDLNSDK